MKEAECQWSLLSDTMHKKVLQNLIPMRNSFQIEIHWEKKVNETSIKSSLNGKFI